MELNYTLTTPGDRVAEIEKITATRDPESFSAKELEIMANYILFTLTDEEKKSKQIISQNRTNTIRKREMSYEGLIEKMEQGEGGIRPIVANDKHIIFSHPISITPEDEIEIPYMRQLRQTIKELEEATKGSTYLTKKTIIELRQDQYILKQSYKPPTRLQQKTKSNNAISWPSEIIMTPEGPAAKGCTLIDPRHVKAILTNYKHLRPEVHPSSDLYYLLDELDEIVAELPELLKDLSYFKMAEDTNQEIQQKLLDKYNFTYSLEYLSSLWQNKIPKIISQIAEERWLLWYYTFQEKGTWKTCTRCGETKLAHNIYFSKNKTDPSGYYSICKVDIVPFH